MNEIRLVESARQGNRDAFCELYGLYKDRLYRYAFYRLGSPEDAEDAVSDCILAAWKQIGQVRSAEAFPAWLYRILSGSCNRRIRETVVRRNLQMETQAGWQPSEEHPGGSLELAEALSQLDLQSRDIVLLSVVAGLDSSEIAKITGLTASGVRSRLSRSLAKMRKFLEG